MKQKTEYQNIRPNRTHKADIFAMAPDRSQIARFFVSLMPSKVPMVVWNAKQLC